jgi:tripartite motif-containing protein 71
MTGHKASSSSKTMRRRVVAVMAMLAFAVVLASDAFGATAQLSGNVTVGGTPDVTKITVTSPGQIQATIQWPTQSALLTLALTDPTGKQVKLDTSTNNPKTITYNATLTGTYKVLVKAKSGSSTFTGSVTYPGVSKPSYAGQIGQPNVGHATIYPSGLTIGPDSTVYVADTGNDQIKAFNPNGNLDWTFPANAARGSRTAGHFANPRDIAYLNGKLYVDDTGNNRVQVIDTTVSPMTATAWTYKFPSTLGISVGKDGAGNNIVLVSEDTANKIGVFDLAGNWKCDITVPGLNGKTAQPRDAATNSVGDVYVAAYQQDRIVEFGPVNGTTCPSTIINQWGTHGTGSNQLIRPYGVDLDSSGNVYVADSDNERIQKFSATGTYLATYGGPTTAGGNFKQLRRVAVGPNGDVYGADLWDFFIDRFSSPTVAQAQIFGGDGPDTGDFNEPSGITFGPSGKLYVADSVNQRMQVFTPGATGVNWTFSSTFGARGWGAGDLSGFNWPRDISAVPGTGNVWVADTKNNRLLEFDASGNSTGHSVSVGGSLTWPYAVDASVAGNLIVADTFANKVESLPAAGGAATWSVNTANGIAFKNPYDVTVANGIAYVADAVNKRIVELNASTGAYITSFGSANLHSPQGVAVDPTSGSIWVSDTSYNKLVQFTSTGQWVQTVGAAGSGNTLQFNHPAHLEAHADVTGHAYLYVTDVYNDRIQILDLNEN